MARVAELVWRHLRQQPAAGQKEERHHFHDWLKRVAHSQWRSKMTALRIDASLTTAFQLNNWRCTVKKYLAEFIGTFTLVLFGCGTAVVAGKSVGNLGIAFAFGFALVAMAYGIGPVSGCHINPAVSVGVFTAGRMSSKDLAGYIVAQILGG
jgi:hypothetical protein